MATTAVPATRAACCAVLQVCSGLPWQHGRSGRVFSGAASPQRYTRALGAHHRLGSSPAHVRRAMSRRVEQVAGGGHGHEEVSKRYASLQALSLTTGRRDAASPLAVTRDNV